MEVKDVDNNKYGFIYKTVNTITGISYIGQRRIKNDSSDDRYLGSGTVLIRAINKYGKENFKREILAYASSQQELDRLEREFIEKFNASESSKYYNIHEGGMGGNTQKGWSKEQKEELNKKCQLLQVEKRMVCMAKDIQRNQEQV